MFAVQAATDNTTHLKNTEILVEKTLLELGVGEMTPGVIKLPFWSMTEKNPQVFYACLNKKPSSAPEHLRGRSLYIAGDLSETLKLLKAALR